MLLILGCTLLGRLLPVQRHRQRVDWWSLGAIAVRYLRDVAGATTVFLVAASAVGVGALCFWWSNRALQPVVTLTETVA